jgi:hypothetical protein
MNGHNHEWYISGFIIKPLKIKYYNNVIFCCNKCDIVHVVVRNRTFDIIEFKTIDELAQVCLQYRWTVHVWPK